MSEAGPLYAVIFGPKRHCRFRVVDGEMVIEDFTETQLGGTYADPPAMRGRGPDGRRRWSKAAVGRETAYALARRLDPDVLRPGAPWDEGQDSAFPALRRLMVKTPEMARMLPDFLGTRPGTCYVQASVHPLRRDIDETPVALDPGGDLAESQTLGWVGQRTGSAIRVTTDPRDTDAVLVQSIDDRAFLWSKPPTTEPISSVAVYPELVRRVGRVSGVIDADEDGLEDLSAHRPVHDPGDPAAFVRDEARRLGPRAFFRRYGVPLKTAERLSLGGTPSRETVRRVIGADIGPAARPCALEGCDHPAARPNALYCSCCPSHKDRAYRRRRKSRGLPVAPDPLSDLLACRQCGVIMLGAADRGGVCARCEGSRDEQP